MNSQQKPTVKPTALVLGAAVWQGGEASPTLHRRATHAAHLWLDGKASQIIGCGGIGKHPPSEARVIADICQTLGVPRDALHLEDASTTTDENIRFALPILQRLGSHDVIVVTDFYHAPRAAMVARSYGLCFTTSSPPLKGAHPVRQLRYALREIPALMLYAGRGIRRRIRSKLSETRSR